MQALAPRLARPRRIFYNRTGPTTVTPSLRTPSTTRPDQLAPLVGARCIPRAATLPLLAFAALAIPATAALPAPAAAQEESYDLWRPQREMVRLGQQAILTCNGLFTSERTLEQVYDEELRFFAQPVGTPRGGDYVIDRERKAVAIGVPGFGAPLMRAAFREGIGCVIMAPDQTFDDIDELPAIETPPPLGDPATIPWPDGDPVGDTALPAGIDAAALRAASDWAFGRESRYQETISLVIVHDGRIVHERYAPGFDVSTRTRTWSTAISIAATLIGILVDEGRLELDAPLDLEWLPPVTDGERDPRDAVTLRDVLQMSSGLYPIDYGGPEYATGSGLGYWAGASRAPTGTTRTPRRCSRSTA